MINTEEVARQRYETAKRLGQSAIYIQAGMRGMSARHELRIKKQSKAAISTQQSKAAIGTQVNTCNDVGKELVPKLYLSRSLNLHIVLEA